MKVVMSEDLVLMRFSHLSKFDNIDKSGGSNELLAKVTKMISEIETWCEVNYDRIINLGKKI